MTHTTHASLWHWTRREGGQDRNLAIGYWQLARIYAVTGRAHEAARYAQRCLDYSREEGPFYLGYAYEVLARAELLGGDRARASAYRDQALAQAELLVAGDERARLLADLATLAV